MTDEQKLKHLDKFKKDFQKLMNKYPEIMVFGDMNSNVKANISLALPRIENRYGNIDLPSSAER